MRHLHSSITPATIHQLAKQALQRSFNWKAFHHSVGVGDLLDLLLLMAATGASLFATVRRFFSFSHETASRAIRAQKLSDDDLQAALLRGLHAVMAFGRRDRQRPWRIAIDTHYVEYYGRHVKDVVGGPKKQGTKWFFGYASAVLLHKRRRYTVALAKVTPSQKPHETVRTLLDQIARQGLTIQGVALDRGFDSGETLLLLQERKLAYVVPLRHMGSVRNRLFDKRPNSVHWTEWKTDRTNRLVRTRVLVQKGVPQTMVFAFDGWGHRRAGNVYQTARTQRQQYRKRFGIETSYRQKNQALATTTSRDSNYRLLLQGIAFLLRQVWVALTEELARCWKVKADAWLGALPFARLLDWLADELKSRSPETRSIPWNTTS
jgi:Transposase DDE domain